MQTIKRRNLNLNQKLNGVEYSFLAAESAIDNKKEADLCVEVLQSNLEGVRDLRGNYYKARKYYFKKKS